MLFRCIVAAGSGRGVFDGNVRVNRLAQKTDAQQLSRNLLLVPRATVNVKPNLQASKLPACHLRLHGAKCAGAHSLPPHVAC